MIHISPQYLYPETSSESVLNQGINHSLENSTLFELVFFTKSVTEDGQALEISDLNKIKSCTLCVGKTKILIRPADLHFCFRLKTKAKKKKKKKKKKTVQDAAHLLLFTKLPWFLFCPVSPVVIRSLMSRVKCIQLLIWSE